MRNLFALAPNSRLARRQRIANKRPGSRQQLRLGRSGGMNAVGLHERAIERDAAQQKRHQGHLLTCCDVAKYSAKCCDVAFAVIRWQLHGHEHRPRVCRLRECNHACKILGNAWRGITA